MEVSGWRAEPATSAEARAAYRTRSMLHLSRMGHCAPTVARTLLDVTGADAAWLVRAAAGLPGGVGNTGQECGGVTAALLLLGLRHGAATSARGLPVIVEQGHAYCEQFAACHGSLLCRDILGTRRLPLPCVKVVRRAPERVAGVAAEDAATAIPSPAAAAYRRLLAHLAGSGFHCAHAVLRRLDGVVPATPDLLAATYGLMGGTVLRGLTCSALVAGVVALGLREGEIEDRRGKVLRMLLTMALGGDALRDDLNRFNRTMNRGKALADWFAGQFGTTQCAALTGCVFASASDVERFIEGGQVHRCEEVAAAVAARTAAMLRPQCV